MSDNQQTEPKTREQSAPSPDIRNAPRGFIGVLGAIGPGIVVIGSVMGSGELINTPVQAAKFGFVLLWAVILSCVIKYFLQIEIGRHTLAHHRTPLESMNSLPVWQWRGTSVIGLIFVATTIPTALAFAGMLGATAGLMHSLVPLGDDDLVRIHAEFPPADVDETKELKVGPDVRFDDDGLAGMTTVPNSEMSVVDADGNVLAGPVEADQDGRWTIPADDLPDGLAANTGFSTSIWTVVLTFVVVGILFRGVYAEMEKLIMVLVLGFSISVVVGIFLIQGTEFAISGSDIWSGLTLSLGADRDAAMFAVISLMGALGATANELFMYPYWILEKGYTQFAGSPDSEGWTKRTRGWIRMLQIDVGVCTVLTTIITAAYFLMGASVLHGQSVVPKGPEVVNGLARMFTDTYGEWSRLLFLGGAFCTLFSTMIVGIAAFGRMWGDTLVSLGFIAKDNPAALKRCHRIVEAIYYFGVCMPFALATSNPARNVIFAQWFAGLVSAPPLILAICWLAFRTDKRVRMGKVSAVCLIVSVIAISICLVFSSVTKLLGR